MFLVQNGLLLFMTLEIIDLKYTWKRDYYFVVYLSRFICCIALHLKLTPNISKGLELMNFANNHPDAFTNDRVPVIAGFMQVFTAIFGEAVNLSMLLGHREVERCIIHFITLVVVLEMAQMYYGALTIGMGVAGEAGITIVTQVCKEPVIKTDGKQISMSERSCFQKMGRIVYKFLRALFVSLIYYYAPFLVVIIPFLYFYPFKYNPAPRSDILLEDLCPMGPNGYKTVTFDCYFPSEVAIVGNIPFNLWQLFKF